MTPVRGRAWCALITLAGQLTFPAAAFAAGQAFTDVAPGNPYYDAVQDVGATHRLIKGLPNNQTFNGNLPLRRVDFVMTLAAFVKEVEVQTGLDLSDDEVDLYSFEDIPDPAQLAAVTAMANDYNLFNLIPDSLLDAREFQPDRPVTRYEAAAVFDSLMQLMETKGIVTSEHDADPCNVRHDPFSDVSSTSWADKPVIDVVQRYHIMVGTTAATFQGDRVLTRYEFAAMASKTFGVIRQEAAGDIVLRRPQADAQEEVAYTEFHGEDPWQLSAGGLFDASGFKLAGGDGTLGWVGYRSQSWSSDPRLVNPSVSAYHLSGLFQTLGTNLTDSNGNKIFQNNPVAENLLLASVKLGLVGSPPNPIQWEVFVDPALIAGQVVAASTASGSLILGSDGKTAASGLAAGFGAMVGGTIYDRTPEGALDVTVEGGLGYVVPFEPAATPFLSGVMPMLRATIDSHLFLTQTAAVELPEIQIFMLPGTPARSPQASPSAATPMAPQSPGLTIGGGIGLSF